MKTGLSLGSVGEPFAKFGRFFMVHNRMIYFVLFISILISAIIGLNLALYQPSDEDYRAKKLSETQSPRFDTATIEKIQRLNSGQQTTTETSPAGSRTNPFGE